MLCIGGISTLRDVRTGCDCYTKRERPFKFASGEVVNLLPRLKFSLRLSCKRPAARTVFPGKQKSMGSMEEARIAAVVLLAADPTPDIRNAREIVRAFKAMRERDRSKLNLPYNL